MTQPDPELPELDANGPGTRYATAENAYQLALNAYAERDLPRAIHEITEAIHCDTGRAVLYSVRGLFNLEYGQQSEAAHDFRQALEIDPSDWLARYGSGILRLLDSDFGAALNYLTDGAGQLAGPLLLVRDTSRETLLRNFTEEIVDMVIHDVRSPLTGIVSSLRLVEDMIKAGDFEDVAQVVEIALTNGNAQLRLIETLIEIREMEMGRRIIRGTPCSLHSMVVSAIAERQHWAADSGIRLLNLIPETLPMILADETLVDRVIGNLLDNALRHVPANGEARVEATVLPPQEHTPATVRVTVTDTGHGIPLELRERVFGKFFQVSKSALRGRRGPGLGLTYCRYVIEAHGGKIWVEDGPEGGAQVAFTLAVATDPEPVPDWEADGP